MDESASVHPVQTISHKREGAEFRTENLPFFYTYQNSAELDLLKIEDAVLRFLDSNLPK
jgi:hypothetical protein